LDIPDHKSSRLIWIKDWYNVLTDKYANVAMLDEKWFYTTNRRRKIKKLHIGPGEIDGDDTAKHLQMRSRRFSINPYSWVLLDIRDLIKTIMVVYF